MRRTRLPRTLGDALRVQRAPDGVGEPLGCAGRAFGDAGPHSGLAGVSEAVGVPQRASASRAPPLEDSLSPTARSSAGDTVNRASLSRLAALVASAARSASLPLSIRSRASSSSLVQLRRSALRARRGRPGCPPRARLSASAASSELAQSVCCHPVPRLAGCLSPCDHADVLDSSVLAWRNSLGRGILSRMLPAPRLNHFVQPRGHVPVRAQAPDRGTPPGPSCDRGIQPYPAASNQPRRHAALNAGQVEVGCGERARRAGPVPDPCPRPRCPWATVEARSRLSLEAQVTGHPR